MNCSTPGLLVHHQLPEFTQTHVHGVGDAIQPSSPVAYWAPTDFGSSSFSILSFCLFILFMGFLRQEYCSGLPFPSPVDHILSDLSTMIRPSWVAPHGMAYFHWFRQGCGPCDQIGLLSVIVVSVCLPSDPLSQCLLSYLGFSYLGRGFSLQMGFPEI